MNARELRESGYTVIFRNPYVWLYRRASQTAQKALNAQGNWMAEPFNVNDSSKWSSPQYLPEVNRALADDFYRTARACYCSSLGNGNCDFCAQVRPAPND